MKLADLPSETLDRIGRICYDSFFEKHEGPWDWKGVLKHSQPEFLRLGDYDVLLPVDKVCHPNISMLRTIVGEGCQSLTLFLKDTTNCHDPRFEKFDAGVLAVCDKLPGENFFVAIAYHAWHITFK